MIAQRETLIYSKMADGIVLDPRPSSLPFIKSDSALFLDIQYKTFEIKLSLINGILYSYFKSDSQLENFLDGNFQIMKFQNSHARACPRKRFHFGILFVYVEKCQNITNTAKQ